MANLCASCGRGTVIINATHTISTELEPMVCAGSNPTHGMLGFVRVKASNNGLC